MEGEIRVTELNQLIKDSRIEIEILRIQTHRIKTTIIKAINRTKKTNIIWQTIKNGQS